jgi:ferrochelatase
MLTNHHDQKRTGVLVLNMGGPEKPAEIQPYLRELLRDRRMVPLPGPAWVQEHFARMISERRAPKVAARYAQAARGASPLNRITGDQCLGLEERLATDGGQWRVRPAFRYQPSRTDEAVAELAAFQPLRLVFLSLYPFFSEATGGSSLADARERWRARDPGERVERIEILSWPDHPPYLDFLSRQVTEELGRLGFGPGRTVVLCSVHGLPEAMIRRGDPYREQVGAAVAGLRRRLPGWSVELGFQSKFGPGRWLQPYTADLIGALAAGGAKDLLMVPLGFVAENLETLYDMDTVLGPRALAAGLERFARLACPNTDPQFLDVLAGLVKNHLTTAEHGGETGEWVNG